MNYNVATTLSSVIEAWCTVYKQYLASCLIKPNDVSIFTFPQYISNNTAVILGKKMGLTVSTVSAVLDSQRGLPLDANFKRDLDSLRRQGKKLVEIGLFADVRRDQNNYSGLVELMCAIARFGVYSNHHDYVIGVHPRRVQFFGKVFGFKPVSPIKEYDSLNDAPVVLLHACGKDTVTQTLEATQKIYDPATVAGLDFSKRYLFNPHNFISNLEFEISVENLIRKVWNTPMLKTA